MKGKVGEKTWQALNGENVSLRKRIRNLEDSIFETIPPLGPHLTTNERGYLGEQFAKYYLTRCGFKILTPLEQISGCDLVVENLRYFKCEVKSTIRTDKAVGLTRLRYVKGDNRKREHYSSGELDVFILVNLQTQDIWFVPWSEAINTSKITMVKESEFYKFRCDITIFGPLAKSGFKASGS